MYHIEEVAGRPACWKDIKYFRRVETMDQINDFITNKLANCVYRRTFRVYWHHDAAKEAILEVQTEYGEVVSTKDISDQRKDYEKDLDYAQWQRLHRNRQYGRGVDLGQWIKTAHTEFDRNIYKKQRMRGKETRNWLRKS